MISQEFTSKVLDKLKDVSKTLYNPYLEEYKDKGGKVIGCLYHYIPEELITAAGLLPIRMRATGSTQDELSEKCFTQINCSFVRHLFDSGVRGRLDFLDGVVTVNSCDHLRRFFENWEKEIKTPYMHFLIFPKKRGKEQVERYHRELEFFKKSLEESFGVKITDVKLSEAIKLHNETRKLQRRIYELRRQESPKITGADLHAVMVVAESMPRKIYNDLLKELIADLEAFEGYKNYGARLVVVGGEIDEPKFLEAIESQGCIVVDDSLGYGYRAIAVDVREDRDPLTALAQYQVVERPACPRICGTTFERDELIKNITERSNASGVISVRLPFCDEWSFEQVNLMKYLKPLGIPHMPLDVEYILEGTGQLKTRVQAFVEAISEG